ncbi:MAG TPA: DUF5665 domain-containing protein [Candidatus Saccharimonadales bacterium]|nr:DUF5665 domain-containing protein [Candidatus Saccharimonadales bacterium]
MGVKKIAKDIKDSQIKGAPRAVLEDLFDDYYKHRNQLYVMNFWRGLFFGAGSVIGGTLIVALLLWVLSALQFVPFLDGITSAVQQSLERRGK